MVKIMGIDCSTQSLAFSIFEDDRLTRWGEVTFGKGDIFHRSYNANKTATALAASPDFVDIDAVCYEAAVFINNRQTVIDLATLLGAAVSPFVKPGVECSKVPAVTWQNYIGNKPFTKAEKDELRKNNPVRSATWLSNEMRNIRKGRTMAWVKDTFGLTIDNDNVADAISVGFWRTNNG